MRLLWSSRSPYVRKVMVAAIELGVEAQLHTESTVVTLHRINADALKINPLGKIPALIDEQGEVWFDSLVICERLQQLREDVLLFPADAAHRLEALRWHALGSGLTDLLVLWRNEKQRPPEQQSADHLQAHAAKVAAALDALEATVPHWQEAPLHIGHLAIGVALGYADFRFGELAWRENRPRLAAWAAVQHERESYRRTEHVDPAAS